MSFPASPTSASAATLRSLHTRQFSDRKTAGSRRTRERSIGSTGNENRARNVKSLANIRTRGRRRGHQNRHPTLDLDARVGLPSRTPRLPHLRASRASLSPAASPLTLHRIHFKVQPRRLIECNFASTAPNRANSTALDSVLNEASNTIFKKHE